MKKKDLIGILVFLIIIVIIIIIAQTKKAYYFPPEEISVLKKEEKEQIAPKKKDLFPQKNVRNFEELSPEELEKNKNLKTPQQEFDLSPSIEDLIRFKKNRIKVY